MNDTTLTGDTTLTAGSVGPRERLGLMIAWSKAEPDRVGEILLPPRPGPGFLLGRGPAQPSDDRPRLVAWRLRPGERRICPPLGDPRISRSQATVQVVGGSRLRIENLGRRALLSGARPVEAAELRPGESAELDGRLLLICVEVPPGWVVIDEAPAHPYGRPDVHGIVGEGPAAWALRARLAQLGGVREHVLIRGPSGSGKELAARALHSGGGPLLSRSAATMPEGLIDAELFGNLKDYPNPGTPERPGLIGAADGGTLFLDEIAELPEAMQARLLRVLDDGEYQRLGESRVRRARFRLLAATNRPDEALKADVLARFPLRLVLPGLNQRREDIPLLAAHLLRHAAADEPLLRRFFPDGDLEAAPRIDVRLMRALLTRDYSTHARELWHLLLDAALQSEGDWIELPAAPASAAPEWRQWIGCEPAEIPPSALQACLDDHNGRLEDTWQVLGLNSRHVLRRLIKKHGLTVRRQG